MPPDGGAAAVPPGRRRFDHLATSDLITRTANALLDLVKLHCSPPVIGDVERMTAELRARAAGIAMQVEGHAAAHGAFCLDCPGLLVLRAIGEVRS